MKKLTINDLAERWGISPLTTRRRLKKFGASPSGLAENGKLEFPITQAKRVEAEHAAAIKEKLSNFAEAA